MIIAKIKFLQLSTLLSAFNPFKAAATNTFQANQRKNFDCCLGHDRHKPKNADRIIKFVSLQRIALHCVWKVMKEPKSLFLTIAKSVKTAKFSSDFHIRKTDRVSWIKSESILRKICYSFFGKLAAQIFIFISGRDWIVSRVHFHFSSVPASSAHVDVSFVLQTRGKLENKFSETRKPKTQFWFTKSLALSVNGRLGWCVCSL